MQRKQPACRPEEGKNSSSGAGNKRSKHRQSEAYIDFMCGTQRPFSGFINSLHIVRIFLLSICLPCTVKMSTKMDFHFKIAASYLCLIQFPASNEIPLKLQEI